MGSASACVRAWQSSPLGQGRNHLRRRLTRNGRARSGIHAAEVIARARSTAERSLAVRAPGDDRAIVIDRSQRRRVEPDAVAAKTEALHDALCAHARVAWSRQHLIDHPEPPGTE